ncbi:mediator of RNA polymerase II transcription subunit 15-like [Dioscorea cayenensis subsp. rotundata]|uniref:Mediator of RNA polymerase II transcription subunit 15-like n=1 Tax=Dioscorea cayennensis subsp. rotundata TaxID=55577 RepID=A0AB40D1D0_DIOCR|nr:mediator of RNA polymerase II transcription subunit 15-like [Dioscorea cayenensis subsp. rotundata]
MQKVSSENQESLKQQMPNLPAATQFPHLQAQQSVSMETQSAYEEVQSAYKKAQSAYLQANFVYLQAQTAYRKSTPQLSSQLPLPPLPPPPPMSMPSRLSGFGLTSSASNQAPPQMPSQLPYPSLSMSMTNRLFYYTSASNQAQHLLNLQAQLANLRAQFTKLQLSSRLPPPPPPPPMPVPTQTSAFNQAPCSLSLEQTLQQNCRNLAENGVALNRITSNMPMPPQLSNITSASNQAQQILNLQAQFAELQAQFTKLQLSSQPTQTPASNQVPCSLPLQQQLQQNGKNLTESGDSTFALNRMAATLHPMSVQPQFSGLMTSTSNQAQQILNLQAQFEELQAQFSKLQLSSQPTQTWVSNQVPCSLPLQEQLQQNDIGDDDDDLQSTAGSR